MKRPARVRVTLVVTAGLAVLSSCTHLDGDRFVVGQTEDRRIRFVACADDLPADASVWRTGPNAVVGDADDDILWGPASAWMANEDGDTASLITDTPWEAGLSVAIAAETAPTAKLGNPPGAGTLLGLDGTTVAQDDFIDSCG